MRRKQVVLGFLGVSLDNGPQGQGRWQKWRPTVNLCQHEELIVDRLELLVDSRYEPLADRVQSDIEQVSPETEVRQVPFDLKDPWDFEAVYAALLDFALNYAFDLEQEEYYLHITTGTHVAQICMFLLAEARYFPASLVQSSPKKKDASEAGRFEVIDLDLSKYDSIAQRFDRSHHEGASFLKSGILTQNAKFNAMIEQIEKVAIKTTLPVLLIGPTGAGKSLLAKRIYELKKSRHQVKGEFVSLNCAALKGLLAMSALFGHKKGAFHGATQDRAGLLRSAHQGVLFLDEIVELGEDEQAMLLSAIESGCFYPLGSDQQVSSEFQLIVGSTRDLTEAVKLGHFREDLLVRLQLWTYELPGLRDRREDIEPNIEFELAEYSRLQSRQVRFNKEAREQYVRFALSDEAMWTANFRDLSGSIHRMATLADSGRIGEDAVGAEIDRLNRLWRGLKQDPDQDILSVVFDQEEIKALDLFERFQLAGVLRLCKTQKTMSAAGRLLFAQSRQDKNSSNDADRLSKYLARFDLSWKKIKQV